MPFQHSELQLHEAICRTEEELKYCKNHLSAAKTTYFWFIEVVWYKIKIMVEAGEGMGIYIKIFFTLTVSNLCVSGFSVCEQSFLFPTIFHNIASLTFFT